MKFKIVNIKKFVRSVLIIVGIVICIGLFIGNISFSHVEKQYKTIYVDSGDTLWSIAKEQKENNSYYEEKDIREIVDNIKAVNKLSGSNINENQKLIIPVLGQI